MEILLSKQYAYLCVIIRVTVKESKASIFFTTDFVSLQAALQMEIK